ncbi:MAG TPA: hypothetical protein VF895_02855 [Gaiellaceae bacterium]
MGFIVSLLIIAVGAILTWGVQDRSSAINLDVVGVVLMIVGLIGFVLTMFFWESWLGPGYFRRTTYGSPRAGYDRPRRGYVVEEDDVPPPAGPPY